jgi:hypothetical protein
MQFCIEEWKSGQYQPTDLNITKQLEIFESHLTGLEIYMEEAAVRMEGFQKEWYNYGM